MSFAPLPTIADCGRQIRTGTTSIPALIERCLSAIAAGNDTLHAIVAYDPAQAMRDAHALQARLDRGEDLGALHGIPIVVKDTIRVEGMPTGYGSRALAEPAADRDATVVARLRAAGAVILGKATTWELGCGVGEFQPENPFPEARNPVNPAYFAGGSSSGSAVAVAAGFACGAIGGDTGGSIRSPASACGIVGLKPSFGLLDRDGAFAHSLSLDHIGCFACDPDGAQTLFESMAGLPFSKRTPIETALQPRLGILKECPADDHRIGYPGFAPVNDLIGRLRALGTAISEVSHGAHPSAWRDAMEVIGGYESHRQNADLLRPDVALSPAVRHWLMGAAEMSPGRYSSALGVREDVSARLQRAFDQVDILMSPTAVHPVPLNSDEQARMHFSTDSSLAIFNLSGHPAMSVPIGFDCSGLPVGLQLTARRGHESLLSATGAHLMRAAASRRMPEMAMTENQRHAAG